MFNACKAQSRRLKIMSISPELMMECLLSENRDKIKVEGMPDGVRIDGVCWDEYRRTFNFRLEHESFDEVEGGSMIPKLDVQITRVPATVLQVPAEQFKVVEFNPEPLVYRIPLDRGNAVPECAKYIPENPFYEEGTK